MYNTGNSQYSIMTKGEYVLIFFCVDIRVLFLSLLGSYLLKIDVEKE